MLPLLRKWGRFSVLTVMAATLAGCHSWPSSATAVPPPDKQVMQTMQNTAVQASQELGQTQDTLAQQLNRVVPVFPDALRLPAPPVDLLADRVVDINMTNAPLADLLTALADQLGMNLIIEPRVLKYAQRATLSMHKSSARDVLSTVFQMFDISGSISGNLLTIHLMENRLFKLEMLSTKSLLTIDDGGDVFGEAGKQSGGNALRGNTRINDEVGSKSDQFDELGKSIQAILGEEARNAKSADNDSGQFTIDRASGTLLVTARPSKLRLIEQLVDENRAVRLRQVQIEAQLIDVQLSDTFQLGVDWNLLTHNLVGRIGSGATSIASGADLSSRAITIPAEVVGASTGVGAGLAVGTNTFSATIDALRTFGTVKMLSNPVVRVSNGVPAYLSVGQNIRYVSKISTTVNNLGGSSSTTSSDVQTDALFSGVVVGVSAFVNEEGRIALFIHPMQTQVDQTSLIRQDVGNGNSVTLPIVNMKGITTNLNVNSGDTVIIGGLIDQTVSTTNQGIPGLADIPVIGKLFDNINNSHSNRELVVVIRARSI